MYIADAMGYMGSVSVLLYKQFGFLSTSWLHFFTGSLLWVSVGGAISVSFSIGYFYRRYKSADPSLQIVLVK
jgi:hypothetical protein